MLGTCLPCFGVCPGASAWARCDTGGQGPRERVTFKHGLPVLPGAESAASQPPLKQVQVGGLDTSGPCSPRHGAPQWEVQRAWVATRGLQPQLLSLFRPAHTLWGSSVIPCRAEHAWKRFSSLCRTAIVSAVGVGKRARRAEGEDLPMKAPAKVGHPPPPQQSPWGGGGDR